MFWIVDGGSFCILICYYFFMLWAAESAYICGGIYQASAEHAAFYFPEKLYSFSKLWKQNRLDQQIENFHIIVESIQSN